MEKHLLLAAARGKAAGGGGEITDGTGGVVQPSQDTTAFHREQIIGQGEEQVGASAESQRVHSGPALAQGDVSGGLGYGADLDVRIRKTGSGGDACAIGKGGKVIAAQTHPRSRFIGGEFGTRTTTSCRINTNTDCPAAHHAIHKRGRRVEENIPIRSYGGATSRNSYNPGRGNDGTGKRDCRTKSTIDAGKFQSRGAIGGNGRDGRGASQKVHCPQSGDTVGALASTKLNSPTVQCQWRSWIQTVRQSIQPRVIQREAGTIDVYSRD